MKKLAALLVLALASVALVACGGSDSTTTTSTSGGGNANAAPESGKEASGGGGGSTLEFEADPSGELAYTTSSATAKAGQVTVDFNNPQGLQHDVVIEDSSGKKIGGTDLIASEETSATVSLKPGKYTFFCSVPGHREAGMEGTLTVE